MQTVHWCRARASRPSRGLLRILVVGALLAAAPVRPVGGQPARPAAAHGAREAFALVVHPGTEVDELRLSEARRLFLGEQQFWQGGTRVVLFVQARGTPSRGVLLRHLFRMREAELQRYWIAKTFRDEVAAGPKLVPSDEVARRLTATVPGAIALIPASEVDGKVKVLRIDGRLPGDPQYPLVSEAR